RRRHTRSKRDWSSDVCSSDLENLPAVMDVIKERGHLLLPLLFLLYMLFFSGTTILFAAVTTIFVTIAAAMVRKSTRMSLLDIVRSEERRVGRACKSLCCSLST